MSFQFLFGTSLIFFDRNRFYNNVCATNICIGRISWKPPNPIGRGELCGTLHYFLIILFVASPFICFFIYFFTYLEHLGIHVKSPDCSLFD